MSSANKARLAFGLALGLLLLGGIATAVTIAVLVSSARWVAHTYEVKTALGEVSSSVSSAARARFDYVHSGDAGYLRQYESLKQEIRAHLEHVRDLTRDNPSQQLLA